jgi:hypothetical protein
MKTEAVKEFWLVGADGECYQVGATRDGEMRFGESEPPYEDCDFDALTGLLAMEGTRYEKGKDEAVQADDESAPNFWPATAAEAASVGLLAGHLAGAHHQNEEGR